jgi:hypothetical protein
VALIGQNLSHWQQQQHQQLICMHTAFKKSMQRSGFGYLEPFEFGYHNLHGMAKLIASIG